MSGRFLALCVLGLAGSLFVGYCVYFDSKRRSDPDYKKKVLARESKHVKVCIFWDYSQAQLMGVRANVQGEEKPRHSQR